MQKPEIDLDSLWEGKTPCPKFNQEVAELKESIETIISNCYDDFYCRVHKSMERNIRYRITDENLQEVLVDDVGGQVVEFCGRYFKKIFHPRHFS